jgi:rod shape-determining protein MreB and related proteins
MVSILNFTKRSSLAIDLGNNNTILTNKNNTPESYPSFIAFNSNNSIRAVGKEAYDMSGKTNGSLKVVKPMKNGVIKDYESARKMLQALVKATYDQGYFLQRFNTVISGVPYSTTEVERRALRDTLEQFSASRTYLLFEPLAAAIGMGINIQEPNGNFIVDIGGGITEAVVVSLSGIVTCKSIKIAGDTFDQDIQEHIRKNYNIEISDNIAEKVKIHAGAAWEILEEKPEPFHIIGKDTVTSIPKKVVVDHTEITYVLNNSLSKIEQLIIDTLEECPPELSGDIFESGIHLTGGGSLLRGLKQRLEAKLKIPIHQDPNALLSVNKGISIALNNIEKYKHLLIN